MWLCTTVSLCSSSVPSNYVAVIFDPVSFGENQVESCALLDVETVLLGVFTNFCRWGATFAQ